MLTLLFFSFSRKGQPKITFKIFIQIFILALLGLVSSSYSLANSVHIMFDAKTAKLQRTFLVVKAIYIY